MSMAPAKKSPRISTNDLALYMVSSETMKLSIIKRAKYPKKSPMIRYKDVRPVLCSYLSDIARSVNPLVTAEQMFTQRKSDMALGPLLRDDAAQSIAVIHAVQAMSNKLKAYDFQPSPHKQPKLVLSGVEVSVHADLLVHGSKKGTEEFGAAILRMTQDDADTETAKSKRKEMGQYVACLARLHAEKNIPSNRKVANRLCMSIDVQHREVFVAPDSNSQRLKNLESACQVIAAVWPTV